MPRGHKKLDTDKAIELKTKNGLSYSQIGKMYGVSAQAVHEQIAPLIPSEEELKQLKQFNDNEAQIYAGKRYKLLQLLDDEALKTIVAKQPSSAVLLFNSLFNNQRLIEGKSTAHVDTVLHSISSELTDLIQERNKLLSGADKPD